jgi:acyl-CoA synthetase (AMP-forming)/AMP-acid ligase II
MAVAVTGRERSLEQGAVDYAGASFWSLIRERLKRSPDAAMICDEHGRRLAFSEFAMQAERTAASLQLLGIAPGAVVAWQLTTRLESAVLLAALSRLDVVQVPIVPLFRTREVGFIFEETRPDFAFTPGVLNQFDYTAMTREVVTNLRLSTRVLTVADISSGGDVAALPPVPESGSKVRWIFSTSGTSGKPKCVCHTDQSLMAAAELLGVGMNLTSRDTTTTNYPIAHCGGPVSVMGQMIFGNRTVYTEQFQPEAAVALYRREGVTVAGTGLPFYQAYLAEQRKSPGVPIIPTLRALQGGGGPAPAQIHHDIQRELGVPLLHVLGMTEGLTLTRHPADSDIEDRAHTVGVPGDGVEIVIVDVEGLHLPPGVSGEILVRGPMVCCGYTSAELNAQIITKDGFIRTGDVGYLRSDGRLVLTGRKKDLIIRKGENISPTEVEQVLAQHPRIRDVAVIGVPDDERGEMACAVVVPAPGEPLDLAELRSACRAAGLATYKTPERLEFVEALPRNAMLKVQKDQLRAQILARGVAAS